MGEIIFYVVLLVVFIVGLIWAINDDEAGFSAWCVFMICALIVLIILTAVEYTPREKPLSKYTVKKEVRKMDVNGTIVSTDTVYIFTKKKDK